MPDPWLLWILLPDYFLRRAVTTETLAMTAKKQATPFHVIADPMEPMNRALYSVNEVILGCFIDPFLQVYNFIAPAPVRMSIKNAGQNFDYPVRLLNTLLQGKFRGGLDETGRFLINTSAGCLGLFDPATRLGIKKNDEDFGKTLSHYGVGPGPYVFIPLVGPCDVRNCFAFSVDMVANPTFWLLGISTVFDFNNYSFTLPIFEQTSDVEQDPYLKVRDFWALNRKRHVLDFQIKSAKSDPVPTLNAVLLKVKDPKFSSRVREFMVTIPATGRKLPYCLWLPASAPLVYILPGIGGHRLEEDTVALAEIVYQRGFSVVTISSAMNWEFMEAAATTSSRLYAAGCARYPGGLEQDSRGLEQALSGPFHVNRPDGDFLGRDACALYSQGLEKNQAAGDLPFRPLPGRRSTR